METGDGNVVEGAHLSSDAKFESAPLLCKTSKLSWQAKFSFCFYSSQPPVAWPNHSIVIKTQAPLACLHKL